MHRVDTATAIATPPAQNPAGTPGYFSQGGPTGSPPATVPGQDWFNSAQEELVAPILAEGLALSKTENNQLYQAIRRISARTIGGMSNVNFASSVAANALTNALKGQNGADPSATNPVDVVFRSTTLIDTGLVLRRFTAAMSITAPQGATFGFIANEIGYLYKYLVDDGATQQLGLCKKAVHDESQLHSTTAIGTGADSDNVLYTTTAVSNAAVRLIGRELIQTGATPGDWSNASTRREVWTPAMNKTAGVLASASASHATSYSASIATFASPVNVEAGDLILCTYTAEAVRNGADFAGLISMGIFVGSAVLESTGIANQPTKRTMLLHGHSIFGNGYIYKSETHVARVATAGTISSYGATQTALYGTAAINQSSHVTVQIVRPNL